MAAPILARCAVASAWSAALNLIVQSLRESTQSPQHIAFEVATVRCNVRAKRPLTCDDAEKPWSGKGRVLLCKQGVVGSSPIVSTVKVLVRGYVARAPSEARTGP
jgi:hypothetical protein